MPTTPTPGEPLPREQLADIQALLDAFEAIRPDPEDPAQRVSFGTSGHRGTSLDGSFNLDHILAISQAICEHRAAQGVTGPLYLGRDTHALSEPALHAALEVFAAAGVTVVIQKGLGYTPTPVISRAILAWNRGRESGLADGVVVTPSHNPPEDGGFKYNPPHGGPAGAETTRAIQDRANEILAAGAESVRRVPFDRALTLDHVLHEDYVRPYLADLADIIDMPALAAAGLHIGADPLGGSGVGFFDPMAEMYGLDITVVNRSVDPTFGFMPVDHDGKIRMDCSSPFAMRGLIRLKDDFDIAFGNDPDFDRHGIVTAGSGLLNPNHYLAVAVDYLLRHRPGWGADKAIGKTMVTSSMVDKVAQRLGRGVYETPVGFKWFVEGLLENRLGFGGEESAGASFLRHDGTVWTTDKDGFIMDLLAAEILAVTGKEPGRIYAELEAELGPCLYRRIDTPATPAQKQAFKTLTPDMVAATSLAGDAIQAKLTTAPGNGAAFGGVKVVTGRGWFAARPSGTENIYKIYAESHRDEAHLERIIAEARAMVAAAFAAAGA
ncbi:MAG: phosphoglucomutase (alpha-D-glucose-1,6-bisphosphate-dependent) [Desulfovibrionaceae bacterium]